MINSVLLLTIVINRLYVTLAATIKFIERGPENDIRWCLWDGTEFTEVL
jgi:hypothetical protein